MKPSSSFVKASYPGAFDYDAALAACAAGDSRALKALYDIEAPRMLGVAMRLLKRQSLAEDAVHDAFLSIWRKASSFNAELGGGRGWMYAILRNRALNMLRGEDRIDFTDDLESFGLASPEESPEDAISRLSDESALRRCLEGLDPPKRNAIVLAYMHGLSHGELAGKLGVPLGTMKSWIRRGLLALKECLG
ncbi:MAG: sigma-70 family RNA polymerase sigma factor [Hyphomicrobiales bacterium]|nr:sigma-70 family RNA polymerase sigma factor [Hyphomicrobiales bacterium]